MRIIGTKSNEHVALIFSYFSDNPCWLSNRATVLLKLSSLTPNALFSQICYVLILHSSASRETFGGRCPNVFYYLLLIQSPAVHGFKHLMFSTAEYTRTGDTSSGLC